MNRLLTVLTATACVAAVTSPASAFQVAHRGALIGPGTLLLQAQLGNGGPVGSGPNGTNNGTGRTGGAFGGTTGNGAAGGGPAGNAMGGGLRPNGSVGQPNGSKPAPMQANGVRKVQ